MKQMYKPVLESPDLVVINYKKALTSKVDKLLEQSDVKRVKTIKTKGIDRVVSDTGLRRNKSKPHNLDQRCRSPGEYKKKGILTGAEGTVEENLIPDLDYRERYRDEQRKLFEELSRRSPQSGFLTNAQYKKDENGRWFLHRNDEKLTTDEFVNFIDEITLKYIKQLSGIEAKEGDYETIADTCQTIVMYGYLVDIISETDFMKGDQTKLWRDDVAVLLSFAALCVILEMLKSKENRTMERTSEQSKKTEQHPVLKSNGIQTIEQPNEQLKKPEQHPVLGSNGIQTIEQPNEQLRKPEQHPFLVVVFFAILAFYWYTCV